MNPSSLPHSARLGALVLASLILAAACLRAEEGAPPPPRPAGEMPPGLLKKFDTNQDGILDETEKAAMEAKREELRKGGEARRAEMMAKYDTDKDGQLSDAERAVMKADRQRAQIERRAQHEAEKAAKKTEKGAAESATPAAPAAP
jgi:hypothetical protein